MSALHIFDMDGTLLRGTSASMEIARYFDRVAAVLELDRRWVSREISEVEFALEIRELWHDLTPEIVAEVVMAAPWIDGIDAVCEDIVARGEHSMLITMSPNFFADHLRERGLDVVCASGFPPLPFRAAVDPALILSPADKVRLAEAQRAAHGLPRSACVAYGDSMSDVPLFSALDNTIAVNGDPALEAIARISYRGASLLEAYAHGRSLLDAGAVTSP